MVRTVAWTVALVLVLVVAVGAAAFPPVPSGQRDLEPQQSRELKFFHPVLPMVPPEHRWPGLAVVDFHGYCITVYVLRLPRPFDHSIEPGSILLSLRAGVVPEGLDAALEYTGYLLPIVFGPPTPRPLTDRELELSTSLFPGGHWNHLQYGDGSAVSGTFASLSSPGWGRYYADSESAVMLDARPPSWVTLDAQMLLDQFTCM